MDQIKLLVKDMLYKIQDIPDVSFTPIRMSEIASEPSSLSTNTSRSTSEQSVSNSAGPLSKQTRIKPSLTLKIERNAPQDMPSREEEESAKAGSSSSDKEDHRCPKPFYLKNNDNLQVHRSSLSLKLPSSGKANGSKIIMGKRALLRSRSDDFKNDPAVVVHELVHEKYQDKISNCIGRMYHRRLSRESRSTDDDGTSSNYSAGSMRTPDSLYDGKSYFSLFFPSEDDATKDKEVRGSTGNSVNEFEVEYDPKEFLKSALGDVSFESQSSSGSNLKQHSKSEDPMPASNLLTKANSLYSSVRKSIRRACSFRERDAEATPKTMSNGTRDRCQSFSPSAFGSSAENLMRELYVQNGIIFQVSKALTYCRNARDAASAEYVEAEKILLVASCHKELIQAALDGDPSEDPDPYNDQYSGTIELSDLTYYLKGDRNCTEQNTPNECDEYFVIVVTAGNTVLSSKVLVPDAGDAPPAPAKEIKSNKSFRLTGLKTDFAINVAIYSLRVKRNDRHRGNESKKERKTPCPSSKHFFHPSFNHKSGSRKSLLLDNVATIKPSNFAPMGSCLVRIGDIDKTQFRMHQVPVSSSLEGYFCAKIYSDVALRNRFSGFLTIGLEDKCHLIWNRRWCVLDGSLLNYWNYPSEEFCCVPVGTLDLSQAVEKSSPADRAVCPRPKSLSLLVGNRAEDLFLTYFLSADSAEEKGQWQEAINFVIGTLQAWNCLCKEGKVTAI